MSDQQIAPVFQIEFEPLGWKYCRASRGLGIPSCKRQCRAFEQEYSAELALDVAPREVGLGTKEMDTDLKQIKAIIDKVGYRGVLPFEALGTGDPRERVAAFLQQIRQAFAL